MCAAKGDIARVMAGHFDAHAANNAIQFHSVTMAIILAMAACF